MRPAFRLALSSRPVSIAALAVLAALSSCGGAADRSDADLSSLDTRLTNSAVVYGASYANKDGSNGAELPKGGSATAGPTLGSLARGQRTGARGASVAPQDRISGACASNVRYGDQWARSMPAVFAVYPGGHLVEAAGIDNAHCALRVVSFTTAAAPGDVVRHYEARARDAGYDAEQQLCKDEHRLGGTRSADGATYMLYARRTAKGVTEVDIVTRDAA